MANIILASGTQERWNADKSIVGVPQIKQLVPINDEPLIMRIQRQFPDSIVVTNNKEIQKHSHRYFIPEGCDVTLQTLFSTRDLWEDWTTILLGDVLYGKQTIRMIKNQREPMMFYGDRGEIYAIKFDLASSMMIVGGINKVVTSTLFNRKYGKLWNLYRVLNNFDFREHQMGAFFTFVNDCQDFDNKKQYLKYAKSQRIRR